MKKIFFLSLLFALLLPVMAWGIQAGVMTHSAPVSDAALFYYRNWDNVDWLPANNYPDDFGFNQPPYWLRTKCSSNSPFCIAAYETAARRNVAQVWNGNGWTDLNINLGSMNINDQHMQGFDVAFETQRERGFVFFNDALRGITYGIWESGHGPNGWYSESEKPIFPPSSCLGRPQWIEAKADPASQSNDILVVARYKDDVSESYSYCSFSWDGSNWLVYTPMLVLGTFASNGKTFCIGYESGSTIQNNAVLVFAQRPGETYRYAKWNGDQFLPGLSDVFLLHVPPVGESLWIECASAPGYNIVLAGGIANSPAPSLSNALWLAQWDRNANVWGGHTTFSDVKKLPSAGTQQLFDLTYEIFPHKDASEYSFPKTNDQRNVLGGIAVYASLGSRTPKIVSCPAVLTIDPAEQTTCGVDGNWIAGPALPSVCDTDPNSWSHLIRLVRDDKINVFGDLHLIYSTVDTLAGTSRGICGLHHPYFADLSWMPPLRNGRFEGWNKTQPPTITHTGLLPSDSNRAFDLDFYEDTPPTVSVSHKIASGVCSDPTQPPDPTQSNNYWPTGSCEIEHSAKIFDDLGLTGWQLKITGADNCMTPYDSLLQPIAGAPTMFEVNGVLFSDFVKKIIPAACENKLLTYTFYAVDTAGQTSSSYRVYNVVRVLPELSETKPLDNANVPVGVPFCLSVKATDVGVGIDQTSVFADVIDPSGNPATVPLSLGGCDPEDDFYSAMINPGLIAGLMPVLFHAKDRLGSPDVTKSISLTVIGSGTPSCSFMPNSLTGLVPPDFNAALAVNFLNLVGKTATLKCSASSTPITYNIFTADETYTLACSYNSPAVETASADVSPDALCNAIITITSAGGPRCGDGIINQGSEKCEVGIACADPLQTCDLATCTCSGGGTPSGLYGLRLDCPTGVFGTTAEVIALLYDTKFGTGICDQPAISVCLKKEPPESDDCSLSPNHESCTTGKHVFKLSGLVAGEYKVTVTSPDVPSSVTKTCKFTVSQPPDAAPDVNVLLVLAIGFIAAFVARFRKRK